MFAILREVYRLRKYVKFIIAGSIATLVDLFILYVLTDFFGVWYLISAVLAFAGAFFVSFGLQKFWTFRDNGRKKIYSQLAKYLATGLGGLAANTLGMYLAVEIFGLWYILAQIFISLIIAIANFLIYQYVIFSQPAAMVQKKDSGLRILIATGLYPPDYRGPATLLESLPRALEKKGFEVKVLTYSDIPAVSAEKDRVFRVNRKLPLVRHLLFFYKLWRLSEWAELIYATDVYSVGYFTYLIGFLKDKKYAIRFTGDSVWEAARLQGKTHDNIVEFQKKKYSPILEKAKLKRQKIMTSAARIVVDCQSGFRLASQIGVSKDRIRVVYNSIETSGFISNPSDTAAIREKYAPGENAKLIITAGELNPWKGFDGVIKVLSRLKDKFQNGIKLLVLGEGQGKEELRNLASRLGLNSNVLFLGKISRRQMINYLCAADLFILNSDYEGCSHLILEAMFAGRPIVVSNSGGNPELIENGKEGLTVAYNNEDELYMASLELLTDSGKARVFAQNAKEKFKNFNWEDTVTGTLKALTEAAGNDDT